MIIICDGFDKTGKSSLSQYIANKIGFQYKHTLLSYNKNLLHEYLNILERYPTDIVIDRFYFTELVYGKVVCRNIRLSDNDIIILEEKLKQLNPLFVHFFADIEIVKTRYKNEKNKYVPDEMIIDCLNEYQNLFNRAKSKSFNVYEFNSGLSSEVQLKAVDELLATIVKLREGKH